MCLVRKSKNEIFTAGSSHDGSAIGLSDVGSEMVNGKLLCDEYAAGGFKVLMPDFMNGALPYRETL